MITTELKTFKKSPYFLVYGLICYLPDNMMMFSQQQSRHVSPFSYELSNTIEPNFIECNRTQSQRTVNNVQRPRSISIVYKSNINDTIQTISCLNSSGMHFSAGQNLQLSDELENNVPVTGQKGMQMNPNVMGKTNHSPMQAFEYALGRLASLGLKQNQPLLNGRVVYGLIVYFSNLAASIMFLIIEANTFWEYTNSIFISIACVVGLVSFLLLIVNSMKIFKFFEYAMEILEDSKYIFTLRNISYSFYVSCYVDCEQMRQSGQKEKKIITWFTNQ